MENNDDLHVKFDRHTLERMVKLETACGLCRDKFTDLEKALILARENAYEIRKETKRELDVRLESMNEFRQQINRLEGSFVTKDILDIFKDTMRDEINGLKKLVYIGVGGVLEIEIVLKFIK